MPNIPYHVYLNRWSAANERAVRRPLVSGFHLIPSTPTRFDHANILGFNIIDASRSPVLLSPPPVSRARLSLPSTFSFKLLGRVDRPGQSWCQVWLAELVTESSQAPITAPKLAIKVFQESLFPPPEWVDYAIDNRPSAVLLSHTESWAYASLYDLQGGPLPHSYGFYDFVLPCGETVCGHVMEFIEGAPLSRDWDAMAHPLWRSPEQKEKRTQRMECFMACVHALHERGVVHRDLSRNNVIVSTSSPDAFVIIDFGNATAIYDPVMAPTGPGSIYDDMRGAKECLQEIEECTEVVRWLKECRGNNVPWMDIFEAVLEQIEEAAESNEEELREEAGVSVSGYWAEIVPEPLPDVDGDTL